MTGYVAHQIPSRGLAIIPFATPPLKHHINMSPTKTQVGAVGESLVLNSSKYDYCGRDRPLLYHIGAACVLEFRRSSLVVMLHVAGPCNAACGGSSLLHSV